MMPNNQHLMWANLSFEIEKAKHRINAQHRGCWFRGHRDGNWLLQPRLLRYGNGIDREETLYVEFATRGAEALSGVSNDWEMLARMQHYGVPTRLLDWTDKLSTALFFALQGESNSPKIWFLNPYLLCAKATQGQHKAVFDFRDDPEFAYSRHFKRCADWPYDLPIPMSSPWKFRRIGQQGGFFTVHGTALEPLEKLAPRFVTSVHIPDDVIEYARKRLLEDGIDEFAIFNDLDHLGLTISKKYRMFP